MRTVLTRGAASMSTALLALVFAPCARSGDDSPRRLGDHPAVVVQRLHKSAGYDYASKFYPHPAWLRLYAEPPRDEADSARLAGAGPAIDPAPVDPAGGPASRLRAGSVRAAVAER